MSYLVCSLNDDGTVAVTTPIPDTRESAEAFAAGRGGEVVSRAVVEGLYLSRAVADGTHVIPAEVAVPVPAVLTVGDFKMAIAGAYIAVAGTDAATQAKWDRMFALLASYPHDRPVRPTEAPLAGILQLAVADKLLTAKEVAAVTGAKR